MKAPTLGKSIFEGFQNPKVCSLARRTLAEDLKTFNIRDAEALAELTFSKLLESKDNYYLAASQLALEVYPNWKDQNIKDLYHEYNWRVERTGSARNAAAFLNGTSLVDIGGGPGTFSLELLKIKNDKNLQITIADIDDWRNKEAQNHPQIEYKSLGVGESLPFEDKCFSNASLLYVLHHVETDHKHFLRELARCVTDGILIFEDVKLDTRKPLPKMSYEKARSLEYDFRSLSLEDQNQFIAVIDFVCNHIASQALQMPVPAIYYVFTELKEMLQEIFPEARIHSQYHGIYKSKCFPNPEALFFVDLKGAKQ